MHTFVLRKEFQNAKFRFKECLRNQDNTHAVGIHGAEIECPGFISQREQPCLGLQRAIHQSTYME